MGSLGADNLDEASQGGGAGGGWLARAGLALLLLAFAAGSYLWLTREQIAGNFIDDYLAESGLEARYDIVSIGAQRQIIANVVVGDPQAPDLTIERVTVDVAYGFGAPGVGAITLDRPRLYGTYRGGALSFGTLDPLLFAESEEPAALPAIDLSIREGGALLETDYGAVGAYLEGAGPLDDGFAGKLALIAPGIGVEGCAAQRATAYGEVTTRAGAPRFDGPVRLRKLTCEGARLASADIGARLETSVDFTRITGAFDVSGGALAYDDPDARARAGSLNGRASLSLGEGALVLDHDLSFENVQSAYARVASLRADGALRSARGFAESSWNAQIEGEGVALASPSTQALEDARVAAEGTLAAPLLAKLKAGLARAGGAARLRAGVSARLNGEAASLVVPEASLRSAAGETLLAISRLSWSRAGRSVEPRLAGNFLTGGTDLPQISGRIDQPPGGALTARLSLAPFRAGADRMAVPGLSVRGAPGGGYVFAGRVRASGAIPGGAITDLDLPINGRIDSRGRLAMGASCETVRFEKLAAYDLALDARAIRACPGASGVMLAYGDALEIDVETEKLQLGGALAGSPVTLGASKAALSYPGGFTLSDVDAVIGPPDNAVRLTSADLSGGFGEAPGGVFSGATARLDAVPLDLSAISARWSYTGDTLRVTEADFTLTERATPEAAPRFNPLSSRGASLTLEGGDITALARLDHKATGTPLGRVAIAHDLSSAQGSALIAVDGLEFGNGLAVRDLTELARGVIAYTDGTVTGEGRIAWSSDDITSSGVFRTDSLDLAAAFGPVQGLRGEVRFTDLINLTTAPGQEIEVGAINPGIEVLDGRVRFSLENGTTIRVEDGRWPFMGGTLIMRPTTLEYGTDKEQRYTLEIIALDAARFVTQMELSNIGATGIFDGTVRIVFDKNGFGRIEDGLLISRAPGGNVSYIGELTYEDMGAISNYAFQSLRSLDYRQMSVALNGDLAGEIITRFRIDGVRQGADASRNFVTRRLARLPIRFNVNVRSENFYELATMVRTFMDPDALPDAVDTGLISADRLRGSRRQPAPAPLPPPTPPPPPAGPDPDLPEALRPDESPDEPAVQPPESETKP